MSMVRTLVMLTVGAAVTAATAAVRADVRIELTRLDGTSIAGSLRQVQPELIVHTDTGDERVAWADVLHLRTTRPDALASAPATAGLRFALIDGSSFHATIEDAADSSLSARLVTGHVARLELATLRAIGNESVSEGARRGMAEILRTVGTRPADGPADARDLALVIKGADLVELRGAVKQIDAARVTFTYNNKDYPLPWERLAGVILQRTAARASTQLVRLAGGEAFTGRIVSGDVDAVTLQSSTLGRLALSWAQIESIDARSEKLVFLSDLPPVRYEFEPFFDKHWPWGRDTLPGGKALRLGGKMYPKGVAMRAQSRLTWNIGGEYQSFVATAGIVDDVGALGCVGLRVLGDGRELFAAVGVRGGGAAREINVPVNGVRALTLEVTFDDDLDIGDQVCWALARLIR